MRCIDAAALVAACILRKNPNAEVIPFECNVVKIALNPCDSVMTNAQKLAKIGGGGTNCSAPLAQLNRAKSKGDLAIYVSDNESWMDTNRSWNSGTETMKQWNEFKSRNADAKLVCIDIQSATHTQAREFADGNLTVEHWTGVIKKVEI